MALFKQYYFSETDQKLALSTEPTITDVRDAMNAIKDSFKRSLELALKENEADSQIGLLLSGGVDSSLLLGMLKQLTDKDIVCFTAMTESADADVLPSKEIAEVFKVRWVKCKLTKVSIPDRLSDILPRTKGGLYSTTYDLAMDVCMEHCKKEGITNLWTGNGLDMFFGGGVDPKQFKSTTKHDFHNQYWHYSFNLLKNRFYVQDDKDLNSQAKPYGVKVVMPFENLDSILTARSIRADLLFLNDEDKYPVRLLAHKYGVPLHEARRHKDPLQHSSGIFDFLRDYMYETLPKMTHDGVNFDLTRDYFENNPNTDLQLFLNLLNSNESQKRK